MRGERATKVPGQAWTANAACYRPYLTCGSPMRPHVHIFSSFPLLCPSQTCKSNGLLFSCPQMSVNQCAVVFSPFVFCPDTPLQHPVTPNRNEQIKTMNKWGVIFLHPLYYNMSWTYLKLCQVSLQASNGVGKLWGETFKRVEKPCCARTETYPSKKQLTRDPYIFM